MRRGKTTEPGLGKYSCYGCKGNENGCTEDLTQGAKSREQRAQAESNDLRAKAYASTEQWSVRSGFIEIIYLSLPGFHYLLLKEINNAVFQFQLLHWVNPEPTLFLEINIIHIKRGSTLIGKI